MITKVFSIYDTKGCMYGAPFFSVNAGTATRSFVELVNDSRSNVNKFPKDYILFELGSFDDRSGEIVSLDKPVNLGLASDFIKKGDVNVK